MKKLFVPLFLILGFFVKAQTAPSGFYSSHLKSAYQYLSGYQLFGAPQDTFTVPASLRSVRWMAHKGDSLYLWSVYQTKWILGSSLSAASYRQGVRTNLGNIEMGGSFVRNDTINVDTSSLTLSSSTIGAGKTLLNVYNTSASPVALAEFKANVAEVYIATNDSTSGFASLNFYGGPGARSSTTYRMTMGYHASDRHVFMADLRSVNYGSWEINGTPVGYIQVPSGNFLIGTSAVDRGQKLGVKGSVRITDSLYVGKIISGATTDSLLVWRPSDSTFRKITVSSISGALGGLADPGSNGVLSRTASNVTVARTLTGTAGDITVTNGDGVSGNPTFDISTNVVTLTGTQTLTNKRITSRINSSASSATPTPSADNDDVFILTALAANATFGAPTGTPTNGQVITIRVKDNGTPRTLAWNAIYRFGDVPQVTTTVANKTLYVQFMYNSTDSRWDQLGAVNNFMLMEEFMLSFVLGGLATYTEKRIRRKRKIAA